MSKNESLDPAKNGKAAQLEGTLSHPTYSDYFNEGIKYLQSKNHSEALLYLNKSIELNPLHFDSLQLAGLLESELNNNASAINFFLKAIEVNQTNPEVYNNCGLVYEKMGQWDLASQYYAKAIDLKKDFAQAYNNLGSAEKNLRNIQKALINYDLSIQYDPQFADPHFNKANILRELKIFDKAYLHYKSALDLNPRFSQAHINLGLLLSELQKYPEALDCFNKAISLDSSSVEALNNKGNLLQKLNQFDLAVESYQKALAIQPNLAQLHSNLGNVYHRLNLLQEASNYYERAIELDSNFAEAHWNNALALLMLGNFKKGWEEFEWRWQSDGINKTLPRRKLEEKIWLGSPSLEGKKILIHSEQGLGDTIQFARFIPHLCKLGAEVTLEVQPSLVDILKTIHGNFSVISTNTVYPKVDFQCPLLSLGLALEIESHNIPFAHGYLKSDPELVNQWSLRLGGEIKPRIGIVCSGNKEHTNDASRSFFLQTLLPHLPKSLEYHLIQKEIRGEDLITLSENPQLINHADQLFDFTQTAALVENMDLVVSVDTSVAHLCGALNKEAWVLLPFRSDWRWLSHKSNSDWYTSVELIRQNQIDDWNQVFETVNEKLKNRFNLI